VSSFGINLDLSVRGQEKFQRAIRTVEQLEAAVKRASKELDLSGKLPGRGAEADKIGTLTKKMNDLAKKLVDTGQSGKTTQAGISDLTNSFKSLARISDVTKGSFKNFVEATIVAEKEVKRLARAEENVRRAFLGMQSLEEREAQLERRANTLRNLRTRKKLKEEEAAARRRNARAAKQEADEVRRLNKERKREEDLRERKRGKAFGDLFASVGFPLLFGGGPGAVGGGAAGSLIGSALGVGFGGQILGSAIGQQLDKLGSAALRTGETFNKLTRNVEQLIPKLGTGLQPGFQGTAQFLVGQGRGSEVATVARDAFEQTYGRGAAQRFEELGGTNREFKQVMEELGVELQDFMSGPLKGLLEAIKRVTGTGVGTPLETDRDRFMQERSDLIPQIAALESKEQLSFNERQQLFDLKTKEAHLLSIIATYTKEINGEDTKRLTLQKILNDVLKQQADIQEKETELVRIQLTARRDSLAEAQGQLAVDKAANELSNTQKQLKEEQNRAEKDTLLILQLQNQEKEQQGALDRARLQLANSVLQAERQIQREQISGAISNIGMLQKEKDMQLQFNQRQQGRFELVEQEARAIEDRFHVNTMVLELENKRALIGVTEAERISDINRSFEIRKRLATEQYHLDLQSLEQANAAYQLSRLQFEQELKLQNLRAGMAAQQQIRQTSPFARQTELMDPYFGGSRQLEIDQQIAYTEQLGLMETQLEDVIKQQQIFALSPAVLQGLEDQERSIRNQIANFKEYQPAIDEAALAQMRFNEAMAIAVPVTDSLFNNLTAVVEGTKTAKEAFADFLRDIASLLMDAAKQMIATYIAIGVARLFAGMGGSDGASSADMQAMGVPTAQANTIASGGSVGWSTDMPLNAGVTNPKGFNFAAGGYVSGPTRALIGEGGQGEYVIPESKMRESMARYSRGARGSSVIPEAGPSGTSSEGGGAAVAAPIDVRYTVERINSVDYVTADQFQNGMRQAANEGAKQGEQQTLKRLQMSSGTRKRLGM
jgi:hypothetical protein